MFDAFISYSRKDIAYVRGLHKALTDSKKNVWIDWRDIPVTSDWMEEIKTGIESADAFIYVMTPDSVTSEICAEEVNYAVQAKKRLIPVVRREVSPEQVNPVVSSHNWLFSREADDFNGVMQKLIQTLDTDLDYVHMHTRLLVRAREWNNHKRNPSFTLRGADLQSAENWLMEGADKVPSPTVLHNEYVNASRKATRRTLTRLLIFALVGAIIMAVFAVFVLSQSHPFQATQ